MEKKEKVKKRNIKKIIIIIILILLLFPTKRNMWDGGTEEYKGSFVYKVTKLHKINDNLEELYNGYTYIDGTIIEIFGMKIYDDTKPVKEKISYDCPKTPLDITKNMISYLKEDMELLDEFYEYSYIDKTNNKLIISLKDFRGDRPIVFFHTVMTKCCNLPCVKEIEQKLVEYKKITDIVDVRIVFYDNVFIYLISQSEGNEIEEGQTIIINKSIIVDKLKDKYGIGTSFKLLLNEGEINIL